MASDRITAVGATTGQHYRWPMLSYFTAVNIVINSFCMGVMSPLLPEIASELNLSNTQVGIVWGAPGLGMLLFSLLGGNAGDRFGIKKVIAITLPLAAFFAAARGFCSSFLMLSFTMFLFGTSTAFIIPNLTRGVGLWFSSRELGRAQGLLLIGFFAGMALGAMVSASVLSPMLHGWRNVMKLVGLMAGALSILWLMLAREAPQEAHHAGRSMVHPGFIESFRKVSRVRDVWYLAAIEFAAVGSFMAFLGLFPKMLVSVGIDPGTAGIYLSVNTWSIIVFGFFGPSLSDKLGIRKGLLPVFLCIYSVAVIGLGLFTGWPLVLVLVLAAVGYGRAAPLFRTIILEQKNVGASLFGMAIGVVFTANRIGSWLLPIVMGWLLDATHLLWVAFLPVVVLNLIAAVLGMRLQETGWRARATDRAA